VEFWPGLTFGLGGPGRGSGDEDRFDMVRCWYQDAPMMEREPANHVPHQREELVGLEVDSRSAPNDSRPCHHLTVEAVVHRLLQLLISLQSARNVLGQYFLCIRMLPAERKHRH
jgi:hypothetical protein